jgi:hypothetical protein
MTDLATPAPVVVAPPRPAPLVPVLLGGVLGGCLLGVAARAWMRLISTNPEFTWSGTIFIVGGFTVFGFTQAVVAVVRARAGRRWPVAVARVVGTIGMMPLFMAAGAIMLPTVLGAGLAWTRTSWRPITRTVCCLIALGPVLFVTVQLFGELGLSWRWVVGVVLMLAIYATIIWAARGTMTRSPGAGRWPVWVRTVAVVLLVLLPLLAVTGVVSG